MGEPIEDLIDAGGLGLRLCEAGAPPPPGASGLVRLGLHRRGPRPSAGLAEFDILISADPNAPAPWVAAPGAGFDAAVDQIRAAVGAQPIAAAVAAQILRASLKLSFDEALAAESSAYSMLLASAEFHAWRADHPARRRGDDAAQRVTTVRSGGALQIRLDRPHVRNAVDAAMRDALVEALQFALDDPDRASVVLSGEGPCFCAGGDLDEFGQAKDPGLAHAIRTLRSAAGLAHRLGPRLTARLHGACVGAGIETAAAAGRVIARSGTTLRLPEVSMGLIPGAGGTASIPRRIGRHRACYMAISGAWIGLPTALDWGLVDAVDDGP